jgi:dTMP kinase
MGLFILFEGIEGSGKSTQARVLNRRLSRLGLPVTLVKEPGGTAVGRVVRKLLKHRLEIELDPLTELFLFAVARAQLVTEVIRPALDQGHIVICDRYTESTVAYQGYGRGLDLKIIRSINNIATGGLRPDIIFLLDLEVEDGLRRKGSGVTRDRFEQEEVAFHRRVRQGYLNMANADPDRWLVIDTNQSKAKTQSLIWQKVEEYLLEKRFLDR